ncbi:MAG TPA: HAD-IIIC family phosphatase, partial [Candidatus Acidoferrales bacterium]|nr:HAD-IIIC family phosphatase [Candidatus Acidoferrales bacterium]
QLAATIETIRGQGRSLSPLTPFKLALVGNGTLDYLVPLLVASAARHGIALECVQADFGQMAQEALDPTSAVNQAKPDAVLLAIDARGLPLRPGLDEAAAVASVAASVDHVAMLRASFRANANALCIVQSLAPPPEPLFGSFDARYPGTLRALCARFNLALADSLLGTPDTLFDVAALAETVGLGAWHSPKQWNVGKLAFDARFLPLYADHVGRILGALRGKARRALILDLDNTIWGGVIGDDGIDGIALGQGDGTGEAFLEVQRVALALRERGIVLAVSSKNNDDVARGPFREHPEMLLREEHIAVFQANWQDKATNIAAIAAELALGTDAMVFLDDNPAERALVRATLPDVAVPELPDEPSLYARILSAAGYFESVSFGDDDRNRAASYEANARRIATRDRIADLDAYLASLKMKITFKPFDSVGRARIAQLINKSNQFNLTTRRYTEIDVGAFEADPTIFTLQVRLEDTFGDNGMIGVVICREASQDTWEIDTWLMSCRVLGRRVEQMVLREILAQARERGVLRVLGAYLPTERNALVRDHYRKLGFALLDEDERGASRWELGSNAEIEEAPMEVVRAGF